MTATLSVNEKRQLVLPKRLCDQARIHPGSRVRAETHHGKVILSAVEPTPEEELAEIIRATGYGSRPEPKNAAEIVKRAIQEVRRGE